MGPMPPKPGDPPRPTPMGPMPSIPVGPTSQVSNASTRSPWDHHATWDRLQDRRYDPVAAAVGNASLLGVGYLLLGLWGFAFINLLVTGVLVGLLVALVQPVWTQLALVVWWAVVTAHGAYAAHRLRRTSGATSAPNPMSGERSAVSPSPATSRPVTPRTATLGAAAVPGLTSPGSVGPMPAGPSQASSLQRSVPKQRLTALAITVPVVLIAALLRVDAWRIERQAADAHRANDCQQALSTLDGLWVGHRVVDAPLVARSRLSVDACKLLLTAERQAREGDRLKAAKTLAEYRSHPGALWTGADDRRAELFLAEAAAEFDTALTGDTRRLPVGFDHLSTVLDEFPDHAAEVRKVLDGFLGTLPVKNACDTAAITDWIRGRSPTGDELDRAADVVPRVAPAAIVGCGDELMARSRPEQARKRYRQLLDEYPDHALAGRAKRGVRRATLAIQLAKVRMLLDSPYDADGNPAYCKKPAPYGGAKPYRGAGKGPYPALIFGAAPNKSRLPSSWLADGPTEAVLVICTGTAKMGTVVRTCPYESELHPFGYTNVDFHKKRIPVRVYELRTGRLVTKTPIEIGGRSCPPVLRYTQPAWMSVDIGPPSDVYVTSSKADVREAFGSVIDP